MNHENFQDLVQSIQNSNLLSETPYSIDLIGFGDPNVDHTSGEVYSVFSCEAPLVIIIKAYTVADLTMIVTCRFNTSAELTETGIIFHNESKIIVAEKFVNVQFLVPFPKYNFTMKRTMRNYLSKLSEKWRTPSIKCPLDFSTNFNSTTEPFNLNWLLNMIEDKAEAAKQEAQAIRTDTSRFLNKNQLDSTRTRRGAPLIAAAAIAGIALFGSGVVMGNSGGCGLIGIFGSCQDQAQENAKNIETLEQYSMALTDYVSEIETSSNEKFFAISNELSEIRVIQQQTIENQNRNWEILEEQFDAIQGNFHILRDCTNTVLEPTDQLQLRHSSITTKRYLCRYNQL